MNMGYVKVTTPVGETSTPPMSNLRTLWDNLTAPAPDLALADKQRARLLAAVVLAFIPVAAIAIFASPISNFVAQGVLTPPPTAPTLAWGLTFIAYFLSRTRNYRWGAYLIIATPILATVGVAFSAEADVTNPTIFFYISLAITFASLLLTARETVITGVIAIILIGVISYQRSAIGEIDTGSMSFALIITVTCSMVSIIRDRNLNALQASQLELQEQIIETRQARERAEQSDKVKSAHH
jgi:sensor histidine kinase YesM